VSRRTESHRVPHRAIAIRAIAVFMLAFAGRGRAQEPFTKGDAAFMQGMIHHHAQALMMAAMAPTHGAGNRVQLLAKKIMLSQRDEIGFMRVWLQFRKQEVPDTAPHSQVMSMPGMDMSSSNMPGMLTEAQLKQLDAARGREFDRLFLTFMIQHHKGAVQMVKELFDSYGAAQDDLVFKFASDVNVDQTTEIARMERMLVAINLGIEQ